MEKKHIKWLQWRLKVFGCKRIMWSQDDAAAISALCIYAVEQMRAVDAAYECPKCGTTLEKDGWCNQHGLPAQPRQ